MAVEYDFYETPVYGDEKEKTKYHARVVPRETISSSKLAQEIHSRSSLTVADVKATIEELCEVMAERLCNGERIHIEGLGYFQITLQCPSVTNPKEIRAESIRFKSVVFRPDVNFKRALSGVTVKRTAFKKHTKKFSNEEIDEKLTLFFTENEYLTRADFEQKCQCTRSAAFAHIKRLLAERKLLKKGHRNAPIYFPMPGNYEKSTHEEM